MTAPASPADAPAARPAARLGARGYLAVLLGVILATALGAAAIGWRLGPPVGDLTRIGGFSERDFGWTGAEARAVGFDAASVSVKALMAGADPGDVLVFGDSFSFPHGSGAAWTEMLAAMTGARVRVVRIADFAGAMAWFGALEAGAARPPKALILQSVERAAHFRLMALFDPAAPCAVPSAPPPVALARRAPQTREFRRRVRFTDFDELMSRGALAMRTRIAGPEQEVLRLALGPDAEGRRPRFSSAAPEALLTLGADVTNQTADAYSGLPAAEAARRVTCGLRRLMAAAESAGAAAGVPALFVLAPDKRAAYAPWIADPLPAPHADLPALAAEAAGPAGADLLGPLRAAIAEGVPDVYWPNDTHWSAAGARLAAEVVLDRLAGAPPAPPPASAD